MWTRLTLWLDGSWFFRCLTAVLDFIKRVAAGGFIAGLFVGDYDDAPRGLFARGADRLLNGWPKALTPPPALPPALAAALDGSWLIRTALRGMGIPVPPGGHATAASALRWALSCLPLWGLAAVVFAAPFLPTMALAGGLTLVFAVTLFRHRFVLEPVSLAVLAFMGVGLFCGVTSFHRATSIPIAVLTAAFMSAFLLCVSLCRTRRQTDFFFFLFVAAAGLVGLVGMYQFFTGRVDMTWVDEALFGEIQLRVYATFGNPNVYGTYLLLALPLAAALVLYAKKPVYKLAALGLAGLLLVNLFVSYSRGCYLALALAALVFVLLIEKRLIIAAAAGFFALTFVLPPTVLNRLASVTNVLDSSIAYRLFIWQGTLRILQDFWMAGLGQGIDAYNVVYPYYAFHAVVAPHSHNLYLQVFVETGIVGLVAFIGMLAWFFRCQARCLRRARDWRDKVMSAAMTAAVVGFLFQGIFDYVFYNYRVMLVFYMFLGLACAFARATERETA